MVAEMMETRMPHWAMRVLPPEAETLGQRMRAKRTALGLSQEKCAGEVGAGQNMWSYWEQGDYFPRKSMLRKIAALLDEPYEDLLALLNADEERRDQEDAAARRDQPAILVYPADPIVEQALRVLGKLVDLDGGAELAAHWVDWAERRIGGNGNPGTNVPDAVSARRKAARAS
jgi:transcriptional regulator with XRE-family HTH domain